MKLNPAAAMIPLLALGIPGEALTAMMLSVFYVHNIIPGPDLFVKHIDFVYGLYASLFLINVIVMIFLLFATKYLLKIIQIPQRFLGVTILGLSFVGVYTLRNSMIDCIVCAVFGIFGYILLYFVLFVGVGKVQDFCPQLLRLLLSSEGGVLTVIV